MPLAVITTSLGSPKCEWVRLGYLQTLIANRQLLSHSSGFTYDSTHEGLKQWKAFHGRTDNTFTGSYVSSAFPLQMVFTC